MHPAHARLQYVVHAGARIAWRQEGQSHLPALILGNSLGSDASSWDPVAARLSAHFRVIRFDARGHGASALEAAARGIDYSIELLARDTLAVADAAGAQRFHHVGVSIGAMVGQWLARHAAQRLDRLVLSNTAAQLPSQIWAERIGVVRATGLASQVETTMERWFTADFLRRGDAVIDQARATFLRVDPDGYLGCAAAVRDMDQRDGLPHIRMPALVIAGQFDPSTPPALGRFLADHIPGAHFTELPLAHMPQLEQPDTFAALVQEFLSRTA